MTFQIHAIGPITALNFERAQFGGTITKVAGATSNDAFDDVSSLDDRIRVAEEFRVVLQLPDVVALQVQQHGEAVVPTSVGGMLGRAVGASIGTAGCQPDDPNPWPVGTTGTIESVNVGVDHAWGPGVGRLGPGSGSSWRPQRPAGHRPLRVP